jgi:hypothetical protein
MMGGKPSRRNVSGRSWRPLGGRFPSGEGAPPTPGTLLYVREVEGERTVVAEFKGDATGRQVLHKWWEQDDGPRPHLSLPNIEELEVVAQTHIDKLADPRTRIGRSAEESTQAGLLARHVWIVPGLDVPPVGGRAGHQPVKWTHERRAQLVADVLDRGAPSVARERGYTERRIHQLLADAAKAGQVIVERSPGRPNRYALPAED